ncbi:MAG: diguanylate cyclase [Clostridiales bacterium]|nr:diguanylate cyclase [Clostridiales bacterium]
MKLIRKTFKKNNLTKDSYDDIRSKTSNLNIVILFFSVLMLVYLGYKDMGRIYRDNLNEIEVKLKDTSNNINNVMDYSIKSLNLLEQVLRDNHAFSSEYIELFNSFEYNSKTNQYYYPVDDKVSISGLGNPENLSDSLKSDLITAMLLTPYFEITKINLPSIQWIYFVSNQNFINLYPPVEAKDYLFVSSTLEEDFYSLTLPDINPTRSLVTTNIYTDQVGAGLMVTLSKPVYNKNTYLGALSLDYTLTQLEDIIKSNALDYTMFILVNDSQEVVAYNNNDQVSEIFYLNDLVKEMNVNSETLFKTTQKDGFQVIDKHLIKVEEISNLPWKLISIRKMSSIYFDVIKGQVFFYLLLLSLLFTISVYFKKLKIDSIIYNNNLKFKQVFDQTVQLMAVLDTKGNILSINQTALKMVGKESFELIGKPFSESPWWNWSENMIQFINDAIDQANHGEQIKEDVIHYDTEDNKHFVEFSMNPIYNKKGQIEYLAANGKDITDRIKLRDSIEHLSKIDMLTNLMNRRGIMEIINTEVSRFNRTGGVFSLILCDVDFFKKVNDTYGHNVGDEVLKALSQCMVQLVRAHDKVGRWGGEEFLIILPNTNYEKAMELSHRIRLALKEIQLESLNQPTLTHITLTFGVTEYNSKYDISTIIKQADDALYYGKNHGRDQVVGYRDLQ